VVTVQVAALQVTEANNTLKIHLHLCQRPKEAVRAKKIIHRVHKNTRQT